MFEQQSGVTKGPQLEPVAKPAKDSKLRVLIPVLLVLAGIVGILYPVIATEYNNIQQRDYAEKYGQQVSQVAPDQREDLIKAAQEYNSKINGIPILDPWLTKASNSPESPGYQEYSKLLDIGGVMGRLRIPSIGVSLPIRHGTSEAVLANGVGHLYGTALPVGGFGTHTVVTAHSAMPSATLFDDLPKMVIGDVFYFDVAGQTIAYQVDQIKTVLPKEIDDLKPVAGKDYATLITCTPYAVNSHRLMVRGIRIPYEVARDLTPSTPRFEISLGLQPWMWWSIAGAGFGVILLLVILVSALRRKKPKPVSQG